MKCEKQVVWRKLKINLYKSGIQLVENRCNTHTLIHISTDWLYPLLECAAWLKVPSDYSYIKMPREFSMSISVVNGMIIGTIINCTFFTWPMQAKAVSVGRCEMGFPFNIQCSNDFNLVITSGIDTKRLKLKSKWDSTSHSDSSQGKRDSKLFCMFKICKLET